MFLDENQTDHPLAKYYSKLSDMERELHLAVNHWVKSAYPEFETVVKWGLLFFTRKNLLFYTHSSKEGSYLGFMKGSKMASQTHLLEGDGKVVRKYYLDPEQDLPVEELHQLIQLAIQFDQ